MKNVRKVGGSGSMPTPESSSSFAKLVEARNRLIEITKRLNEVQAESTGVSPELFKADGARYREVQSQWDAAFREFEAATQAFSASVKYLREKTETDPSDNQ
jgi:hypothetical protein